MNIQKIKRKTEAIRNQIIKDLIDLALENLINFLKKEDFWKKELNDSTLLSARLEKLKRNEVRGIISFEQKNLEYNRIRDSILTLISSIENRLIDIQVDNAKNNNVFPEIKISNHQSEQISNRTPAPEVPEDLIEEMKKGRVIPMIGAGLSISAVMQETSNPMMPTYSELLNKLYIKATKIGVPKHKLNAIKNAIDEGDTKFAARELREVIGKGREEFYRALRDILNATEQENIFPSLAHKLLRILDFKHIISTNYDRILEKLVCPNHEVITPDDKGAFHLFTESLVNIEGGKYLLKMHGDITRPRTILFGEEELKKLYSSESKSYKAFRRFVYDIFTKKTILFLGFSFRPESEGYVNLFYENLREEFDGIAPRRHYALVPVAENSTLKQYRKQLGDALNIIFLEYEPDDKHTQVWEFITYLNTSKIDEPIEGKGWSQWYLPNQREEYLDRQLFFEKKARSVRYLTPTLTNAIATDLHLTYTSYKKLVNAKLITKDDTKNLEYVRDEVIPKMLERRDNLVLGMKSKRLEVRIMFLKKSLIEELDNFDEYTLERYRFLIELFDDDTIDLEIRLLPNLDAAKLKEEGATYGLILGAFPKPNVDVALAYASQATKNYFNIHMIEANTTTAQEKVFQFERYWASAISEQESEEIIRELFSNATKK